MSRFLDRVAFVFFAVSLVVIGTLYGTAAGIRDWFPAQILRDAKAGAEAWYFVWQNGNVPVSFVDYIDEDPGQRASRLSSDGESSDDWILITGGPYEFMEQCPTFGCLAWIVDRAGNVVHSWEADLQELWRDVPHLEGNTSPRRFDYLGVMLVEDGGLLVTFYNNDTTPRGAGLARFDRAGELVWFNKDYVHHWFSRDPRGRIYAPAIRTVESPLRIGNSSFTLRCPSGAIEMDFVAIIDDAGNTIDRLDIFEIMVNEDFVDLIRRTDEQCDPLHLNFVEYLDAAAASKIDVAEEGDLLLSLWGTSTVLLLSPATKRIKWISSGRYVNQHSPRILSEDAMVVFDNMGGDRDIGRSRIVRQSFAENSFRVIWPQLDSSVIPKPFTLYAGYIDVKSGGEKALVSVTDMGEIVEVDLRSGDVVWRYRKIFPVEGFPGAHTDKGSHILTSAFGANYVDEDLRRLFRPHAQAPSIRRTRSRPGDVAGDTR